MAHYLEQIGDYVIEQLDRADWWHVRMAGDTEPISIHESKADAKAAMKRYQAGDKRRARQ